MIFLYKKQIRKQARTQQLRGKPITPKKSQGTQPYFGFNRSGTDPGFGTGLNSMD